MSASILRLASFLLLRQLSSACTSSFQVLRSRKSLSFFLFKGCCRKQLINLFMSTCIGWVRMTCLCINKWLKGNEIILNECYIWKIFWDSWLILFPSTASKMSSHLSSHIHKPPHLHSFLGQSSWEVAAGQRWTIGFPVFLVKGLTLWALESRLELLWGECSLELVSC